MNRVNVQMLFNLYIWDTDRTIELNNLQYNTSLLNIYLLEKIATALKTAFCHTPVNMNCNLGFPERCTDIPKWHS